MNKYLITLLFILFLILTWLIDNYPDSNVTTIKQSERFNVEKIEETEENFKYYLQSEQNYLIIQTEDKLQYNKNDTLKIIGYK